MRKTIVMATALLAGCGGSGRLPDYNRIDAAQVAASERAKAAAISSSTAASSWPSLVATSSDGLGPMPYPGQPLRTTYGEVTSLQFDESGTKLRSAATDRWLVTWSVPAGAPLSAVHCAPFSGGAFEKGSDPELAFVLDEGRSVGFWYLARFWVCDGTTGKKLRDFDDLSSALSFTADGRTVSNLGTIYDVATGRQLVKIDGVWDAILSGDGQTIAANGKDGKLTIRSRAGVVLTELSTDLNRKWARFSPDGTRLVEWTKEDYLRVWQLDKKLLGQIRIAGVHDATFSPDGRTLAVTTSRAGDPVTLIDAATTSVVRQLVGHKSVVGALGWSRDGRALATGDASGKIGIWDPASGQQVSPVRVE